MQSKNLPVGISKRSNLSKDECIALLKVIDHPLLSGNISMPCNKLASYVRGFVDSHQQSIFNLAVELGAQPGADKNAIAKTIPDTLPPTRQGLARTVSFITLT